MRDVRPIRRLGLACLLTGLGACASGPQAGDPFEDGRPTQITIEVLNLNWSDATLHAWRGGERIRLGIVPGKDESTYSLAWDFSLPLRIEIDLLAGGRCVTSDLYTDPGDIIELQIPIQLTPGPDCLSRR